MYGKSTKYFLKVTKQIAIQLDIYQFTAYIYPFRELVMDDQD